MSALTLLALPMLADATHLDIKVQEGEHAIYDLDKIVSITFDGDEMVMHHADGTDRHDINNIDEIVFATFSGIEEIRNFDLNGGLNIAIRRNMLTASLDGETITLRVFDTNGRAVDSQESCCELQYDLASLPKGTYILLVNDKALKFIR